MRRAARGLGDLRRRRRAQSGCLRHDTLRIGKVIALRSSALAASSARAPQPSVPIGAAVEPRPVFTTRLMDAGPTPTPRALPAAMKAVTAGDPSEEKYWSSTCRASPVRNQISPMQPPIAAVIMLRLSWSALSISVASLRTPSNASSSASRLALFGGMGRGVPSASGRLGL
jgi:hypothetical protein